MTFSPNGFGAILLCGCEDNEDEFPKRQATKKQNVAFLIPKEVVSAVIGALGLICLLMLILKTRIVSSSLTVGEYFVL